MDKYDNEYFYSRNEIDSHSSKLTSTNKHEFLDRVLDKVYNHQKAVFDMQKRQYNKEINDPDLAYYFYNNCFIEGHLRQGSSRGYPLTFEEFLNKILTELNVETKNKLVYLKGEVGSGKTALINCLISKYFPKLVQTEKLFFVRVDLNLLDFNEGININFIVEKTIEKIKRVIINNSKIFNIANTDIYFKNIEASLPIHDNIFYHLSELIKTIKQNRNFILIFDNLDGIIHQHDRGLFIPEQESKFIEISQKALDFIQCFYSDNGPLSNLSSTIIFVVRSSTYKMISTYASHSSLNGKYSNGGDDYTLVIEKWQDVIESRHKLFQFAIDQFVLKEETKQKAVGILGEISVITNITNTAFIDQLNSIADLANLQLRELIEYVAKFIWLTFNSSIQSTERKVYLLTRSPLTIIAYILGGKCLYSEKYSNFPNIYLVSPANEKDAIIHPHTYWLKRLILEYMLIKSNKNEAVYYSNLENTFESYNKETIQSALGSLTDIMSSNLLKVELQKYNINDVNAKVIMLTNRAKYCLDKIFDKFVYLQLIADDFYLPLPNKLPYEYRDLFALSDNTLDYSYLTDNSENNSITIITKKIKQTLVLLNILEGSLIAEQKIHSKTFSNLENEGVKIPSLKLMKENIIIEFEHILSHINKKDEIFDTIKQYVNSKVIVDLVIEQFNRAKSKRIKIK